MYKKEYYEANKERIKQRYREWYKRNNVGKKIYARRKSDPDLLEKAYAGTRIYTEKKRFGRPRIEILRFYDFTCKRCGLRETEDTQRLHIDHIDNVGRNSDTPNNNFANLQVLCEVCHSKKTLKERHQFLKSDKQFPNHWKDIYGRQLNPSRRDKGSGRFIKRD